MINAKKFYATFVSLILAIILLMTTVMILQAGYPGVGTPYPGVPVYPAHPGKLLAVVGNDPGPGFYGGYHAMWDRIMPNLTSTLGFSSALFPVRDYWVMACDWSFWDIIWDDPGWQYSSQNICPDIIEPGGWDLTSIEWWTMPTGMLWNDGIILAENVPPTGFNIFPYINDVADNLYWAYQASDVPATRKARIDEWQFELMRNPPIANVYYPYTYDVYGDYVKNWYGTVWWYDIDNLAIDSVEVLEAYMDGYMTAQDRDRLLAGILKYGVKEDWWNYNPLFIATNTEEIMANLITGTLYSLSLNPWPAQGTAADPAAYYSKPDLASGPPVITNGGLTATIPLKTDIWWSDGEKFDAEDVKYTLDLNLVIAAKAVGRGDFAPIVSAVNVGANPYEVVLTLHRPYNDLECILSNSWGLSILPEHYYRSIPVAALRGHISNYDWAVHKNAPVLGPFKLAESTPEFLRYVEHPGWWGNSTAGYGYTIQDTVNEIILVRGWGWGDILTHQIDFGEHQWGLIPYVIDRPDLTVFERPYCASNGVWFNINNPYLSNRYVRLAISYAIPYDDIRANVLPGWGVSNWIAGGNLVHPWQYYGGIQLFNTVMPPYTYNPAWAQAYLDMWKLSRIMHAPELGGLWVNGPVGDADFSGFVELDDYLKVWALNLGKTEVGHTFIPGNDVDADFNNDDMVDDVDYDLYYDNIGMYYPDRSTTQTYPY